MRGEERGSRTETKGGTGCCGDKASVDPRDLWSWGGPLQPGAEHQASASHTHHWRRAPRGSSAIGKAIPIGADAETPPSSWGMSFSGRASGIIHHTSSSLQTLSYCFILYDSKFSSPPCLGFCVSGDQTDALMATVHSKADLRNAGKTGACLAHCLPWELVALGLAQGRG